MISKIEKPENTIEVTAGWVGLVDSIGDDCRIVNTARTSFGKEVKEMSEGDVKLLNYLIDHKHETPLEFVQFQFLVSCPLFIRSQWFRHRMGSFSEISRRYTEQDIEFYLPKSFRTQSKDNKQASNDDERDPLVECNCELHYASDAVEKLCYISIDLYNDMIREGICREQARMILPQNMMTTFRWSANLRSLLNFLILRDDNHAQKEIREFAQAIWQLIVPIVPEVVKKIKGS